MAKVQRPPTHCSLHVRFVDAKEAHAVELGHLGNDKDRKDDNVDKEEQWVRRDGVRGDKEAERMGGWGGGVSSLICTDDLQGCAKARLDTSSPAPTQTTHSTMGTIIKNLRVPVHGTPLSICSHIVASIYSPWSSQMGDPRAQCKPKNVICAGW